MKKRYPSAGVVTPRLRVRALYTPQGRESLAASIPTSPLPCLLLFAPSRSASRDSSRGCGGESSATSSPSPLRGRVGFPVTSPYARPFLVTIEISYWRPKMASLLSDTLFEARGQAPPPSKDFYQLVVTRKDVIFRWWKISLRSEFREARPGELKESHEDFLDDPSLQIQIAIIFGGDTLEHTFNMCRGNFDFLVRLPDPLLLYIISYLDLEDIARLSRVSHRLEMLCNSEKLWEMIVEDIAGKITPEMRSMAQDTGWKEFFFRHRVQLQKRRMKKHDSSESLSD